MARLGSRLRNEKRKRLLAEYAERRASLKAVIKSRASSEEENKKHHVLGVSGGRRAAAST